MTRYAVHLFACLLLTLLVREADAQIGVSDYDRLTWSDGIDGNVVRSATQDSMGFMWFGTPRGLLRYDGHEFVPYRHDPSDPSSPSGDNIQFVYADRSGTIWAGAWGAGLLRYDSQSDAFTSYRADSLDESALASDSIRQAFEDSRGRFWIATYDAGLHLMDREYGTFRRYPFDAKDPDNPHALGHASLRVIMEDRDGFLWLGTRGGLYQFDPEAGTFVSFRHDPDDEHSLAQNNIWSLHQDEMGAIWVGTSGNVLHHMAPGSSSFTRYYYDQGAGTLTREPRALEGNISSIETESPGVLRIAGSNCCMERVDISTSPPELSPYPAIVRMATHFGPYRSRDGVRWFPTGEGLLKSYPLAPSFLFREVVGPDGERPLVFSIAHDRRGIRWIGTSAGLYRYEPATGSGMWVSWGPSDAGMSFWQLELDRRGSLWAGTEKGLFQIDTRTMTVRVVNRTLSNLGLVWGLVEDDDGDLWAATAYRGLLRRDGGSGVWGQYVHDPDDESSLSTNSLQGIFKADDEVVWVATPTGFDRYERESDSFTRFTVDPENQHADVSYDVHATHEDRTGVLWFGTPHGTGGISRFLPETGEYERAFDGDHLAYGFISDEKENLWIISDTGLLMHDPDEDTFQLFDSNDGLDRWNAGGVYHAATTTEDGNLLVGLVGGYYEIDPAGMIGESGSRPAAVVLTNLSQSGRPVIAGDDPVLRSSLWETEHIDLPFDRNSFELTFAALDFGSDPTSYRYMLSGHDDQWLNAGPDRTANYSNVPPGDYTFTVQASVGESDWDESERTLRVTVRPPWWRSIQAYVLYGLFLLGAIVVVDRIQRRRLIRREREQAREKELEQARRLEAAHRELARSHEHLKSTQAQLIEQEKLASLGSLTAGIAHEIKNPLNFVNNFAEVSEELMDELAAAVSAGDVDEASAVLGELRQNARQIAKHGGRADAIVRSMMQHARGGASERETIDVNAFVEEYVDLAWHGMRARDHTFECDVERSLDPDAGTIEGQPQELGRVLLNLLNNAFYAIGMDGAAAEPTVHVATSRTDGSVTINVTDSGPGIPEGIRERIFEPFFTTKPTGEGTGLGLSLSYDIVTKGHGGEMHVENIDGGGARFTVRLPTG